MFDDAQNGLSSSLSTTRRIYHMDVSQNRHQLADSPFHNASRTRKAMRKKLSKTFSNSKGGHLLVPPRKGAVVSEGKRPWMTFKGSGYQHYYWFGEYGRGEDVMEKAYRIPSKVSSRNSFFSL